MADKKINLADIREVYDHGWKYSILKFKVYDLSTEKIWLTKVYGPFNLELHDHFGENIPSKFSGRIVYFTSTWLYFATQSTYEWNHSDILIPISSSRNEHIALLCLLLSLFLTDNFELGLILDGYDPFGE